MTVEVTTLASGLRVVTHAMRDLETVSVGVTVAAGSRHERPNEHGLSHLLEHMAFKGTRRRKAREIVEEIEAVGGDLNAATSIETTTYQARVLAADTGLALDILADILTDSTFDETELAREKNVIVQEIGELQDTPDDLVFDMFNEAAYPDQPIGRPIIGTRQHVEGFSRAAIATYLADRYATPVSVVAAAGAVDHARIVDKAAERFAAMPTFAPAEPPLATYRGGERKARHRLEQTHVVIGFESVSFLDPSTYAISLFANSVGGGMSSRLFQEVREKRGLAYSIYAFDSPFADTGVCGFHASIAHRDVPELVNVSLDCLAEASVTLTQAEVARAKAQMKVSLLAALEASGARAEQMARQVLVFGRVLTQREIVERIDSITLDEVRAAGRRALASVPTIAALGEVRRVPDATFIRGRLGAA